MSRRNQNINLPVVFDVDASRIVSIPATGDVSSEVQAAIDIVSAGGQRTGNITRLVFPARVYDIGATIVHRPNVIVAGVGRQTIFQQVGSVATMWSFQNGALIRGGIEDCIFLGQSAGVTASRVGTCINMSGAHFITIQRAEVWDFAVGIIMSDGTPFAGYNTVGPKAEVNRCTVGIRALQHCNASSIVDSRVFFSFGNSNEGIGIDIDDTAALTVSDNTVESADTCIRVRATADGLQAIVTGNYFEPSTNPVTAQVGQMADINIGSSELSTLRGYGNTYSGLRSSVVLEPSGLSQWDGYAQQFAGARYDGAAMPRRNFVRNGAIYYFNAANVPNWTFAGGVGVAESGTFVTGNRSLQLTATLTTSQGIVGFVAPDEVGWMTIGIRYQVVSGDGFIVNATWGASTGQLIDSVPSAGVWQVRYIEVQRDPAAASGTIAIFPDAVDGVGVVLIDEVWAYSGRYAAEGGTYGERIEMLPAPIVINSQTLTGNGTFGPINILDLPNVLAPPLDDFSTAPAGVVGALYRFTITTDSGVFGTALAQRHSLVPTTPGAVPVIAAANTWLPSPQFSQVPMTAQMAIRGTSIVGVMNAGDGNSTIYEVAIVGWILA